MENKTVANRALDLAEHFANEFEKSMAEHRDTLRKAQALAAMINSIVMRCVEEKSEFSLKLLEAILPELKKIAEPSVKH
jgi:hypothetical protein